MSDEQKLRNKLKAKAWDAANIEKRRLSSRLSKQRIRAAQRSALHGSKEWLSREITKEFDRQYAHRRYLLGLQRPSEFSFFSLDGMTGEGNLYGAIASDAMSPLECLMAKEEGYAYYE